MPHPVPEPPRWRPLKCEGGQLDGQRRRLPRTATKLVERLADGREAVYRVQWRRPTRRPRFAVLRFVAVRSARSVGRRGIRPRERPGDRGA